MEPGYVQYPRPVKRELNFDCIPEAWNVFKMHPWKFIGLSVLLGVLAAVAILGVIVPFLPQFIKDFQNNPDSVASLMSQLKLQAAYYLGTIVAYAAVGPVLACYIRVALKAIRNQPVEGSDIWYGFTKVAGRSIALSLIIMLGVTFGSFCCYVPGLAFGGLMMFAFCFVVDKNYKVTEAMSASWNALKPFWLMASVLYLVLSLLASIGVFACLVGIFVSLPIMYIAEAWLYVHLTESNQNQSFPAETPRV